MPAFRIQGFAGTVPRMESRALQNNQAQSAVNCLLLDGDIVPLRAPLYVTRPNRSDTPKTIYRMVDDDGTEYWLSWSNDVNVAKGPVAGDELKRIYYTGDNEPRMTTLADAISGGANDYPKNFFVLGVSKPTAAVTVSPSGGVGSATSRVYVYTFVTPLGEESAPSPESAVTNGKVDDTWALSAMQTAPANTFAVSNASWSSGVATLTVASTRGLRVDEEISVTGMTPSGFNTASALITALTSTTVSYAVVSDPGAFSVGGSISRIAPHNTTGMTKRIYRTINGSYFFVAEISAATTTYNDTLTDAVVSGQGILKTIGWEMPPADMNSLVELANGMMAGLSGNQLYMCEPYYPYAWPVAYMQALPFQGVALAASGSTVVVSTDEKPYVFSGTHPSAMSQDKPDVNYPNLSKRGTIGMNGGSLYPTHQGLAVVGAGIADIATRTLFATEAGWSDLNPSSFIAAYHRDRYYAAYTDDSGNTRMLIFDAREFAQIVESSVPVTALYSDRVTGNLYVVQDGDILQWDGDDGSKLLFEWFSKEFLFPKPTNLGAAKVEADFTMSDEESASLQAVRNAVIAANAALLGSDALVRTGTTVNGSPVITGLSKTSDLIRWMSVTGTGIPANTKIKSVDSTTQVTLTNNATASGSVSLSFIGDAQLVDGAMSSRPLNTMAFNQSRILALPSLLYDTLQFTLYTDGEVKYSRQVLNNRAFTMPGGYKSDTVAVKLSGNVRVRSVVIADTMKGLRDA